MHVDKNLIPITESNGNQAVSARVLHQFLESRREFSTWMKDRIKKYGLVENQDYVVFDEIVNNPNGGRPLIEYALSLDCAKELAMVEGNSRGKQARQYFIECEKQLKQPIQPMSQLEILQQSVKMLIEQDKRISSVENEVKLIKAQTTTQPDYFTVAGYGTLKGMKVPLQFAVKVGNYASKKCRQLGIMMGECPDPRFGKVRTYPSNVLDEAFRFALN